VSPVGLPLANPVVGLGAAVTFFIIFGGLMWWAGVFPGRRSRDDEQ
jgi:hypothetical protein